MLTNQQQNVKSSLYNAIAKWHNDNVGEINDSFTAYFGDFITELMTDSAFNIILAQQDVTNYHKEQGTNFTE